jgi:hypothetical protein
MRSRSWKFKPNKLTLRPSKASPDASHPILDFYFLINIFMLRMIVH